MTLNIPRQIDVVYVIVLITDPWTGKIGHYLSNEPYNLKIVIYS